MTRKDFQRLTRLRLNDARTLLKNGNNEGAYYLTGLAVECALKLRSHDERSGTNFLQSLQLFVEFTTTI
jgi:hypothetical protein